MRDKPEFQDTSPYAPPSARVEEVFESEEQELASRLSRLGAYLINVLLMAVPGMIFGTIFGVGAAITVGSGGIGQMGGMAPIVLILAGGVMVVYYLGLLIVNLRWLSRYGQSVGKRWLKIRIVRGNGARVGLGRLVFLRYLSIYVGGMIINWIGILASINGPGSIVMSLGNILLLVDALMIFGAARLCLHDRIADTRVVKAAA